MADVTPEQHMKKLEQVIIDLQLLRFEEDDVVKNLQRRANYSDWILSRVLETVKAALDSNDSVRVQLLKQIKGQLEMHLRVESPNKTRELESGNDQ